jgi:chromosome segregation ATPase
MSRIPRDEWCSESLALHDQGFCHCAEILVLRQRVLELEQQATTAETVAKTFEQLTEEAQLRRIVTNLTAQLTQARSERNEFYNATVTLKGQVATLTVQLAASQARVQELEKQVEDLDDGRIFNTNNRVG